MANHISAQSCATIRHLLLIKHTALFYVVRGLLMQTELIETLRTRTEGFVVLGSRTLSVSIPTNNNERGE